MDYTNVPQNFIPICLEANGFLHEFFDSWYGEIVDQSGVFQQSLLLGQ
jgi:hypothetical protein